MLLLHFEVDRQVYAYDAEVDPISVIKAARGDFSSTEQNHEFVHSERSLVHGSTANVLASSYLARWNALCLVALAALVAEGGEMV